MKIAKAKYITAVSMLVVALSNYFCNPAVAQQKEAPVKLSWLGEKAPGIKTGVSWGVPFPKGKMAKNSSYLLTNDQGETTPVQSWPMAYWPDGSLKWVGFSAVVDGSGTGFQLQPAKGLAAKQTGQPQLLTENEKSIQINTGVLQGEIFKKGNKLLSALSVNNKVVCSGAELVAIIQQAPSTDTGVPPIKEKYVGGVDSAVIEQNGPLRAVVKITGKHRAANGNRSWLPFIVRFYFYKDQESIKMVHTIVYDGDEQKDFIRGLGINFSVPMREEMHNRHVGFSGEKEAMWFEPIQPMIGSRAVTDAKGLDPYAEQLAGHRIADRKTFSAAHQQLLTDWAIWPNYKLSQLSSDGFTLMKRTNAESAWVNSAGSGRSSGLAFVGDVSGGMAVGVKDFWQSYPSSLEVRNADSSQAELLVWLWSPDGPDMDMRHYDTKSHTLKASYEDIEKGFSTPYGIGRTSVISLFPAAGVPERKDAERMAGLSAEPPLLVCTPAYYHSTNTFGPWSLPDRSTPTKKILEDQLDRMFSFYQHEREISRWYGFWSYGDIMHTYDALRQRWMYDVGGYAWMNSEEIPDVWLWYSFLRTGRQDIFRMAEAMTRHTQEVDVYHAGRFAGLGSRHNVIHWGDGAKEIRISQAILKRFYYYLTTDERTGDLMHEVTNADYALVEVDPLRHILPKTQYPTHIRTGPDWLAAAGNWMTEWERTGNVKYRDKILTGMKSVTAMPKALLTGLSFGYDPKTGMLHDVSEKQPLGQFLMIMGGAEVAFELATLLDEPKWSKAWLTVSETWARNGKGDMAGPRAAAYAAFKKNDPELGKLAWQQMFKEGDGTGLNRFPSQPAYMPGKDLFAPGKGVPPLVATGHLSQWALNIIEALELAGKWLPETPEALQPK
jgi:hypothetical protein